MEFEVTSAVQPVMQTFMRQQMIMTEASKAWVLLPANPQLLPIFTGALMELFRIPAAMSKNGKDKSGEVAAIEKDLMDLQEEAFAETERFMNAQTSDDEEARRSYRYPLALNRKLNKAYNDIYVILDRLDLILPKNTSIDIRKEMKQRAVE